MFPAGGGFTHNGVPSVEADSVRHGSMDGGYHCGPAAVGVHLVVTFDSRDDDSSAFGPRSGDIRKRWCDNCVHTIHYDTPARVISSARPGGALLGILFFIPSAPAPPEGRG